MGLYRRRFIASVQAANEWATRTPIHRVCTGRKCIGFKVADSSRLYRPQMHWLQGRRFIASVQAANALASRSPIHGVCTGRKCIGFKVADSSRLYRPSQMHGAKGTPIHRVCTGLPKCMGQKGRRFIASVQALSNAWGKRVADSSRLYRPSMNGACVRRFIAAQLPNPKTDPKICQIT